MKVLQQPIEMITVFNTKGELTPIKFRITEGEELITCVIQQIITKEKVRIAGKWCWQFDCQIVVNNVVKRVELRYILDKTLWVLYKM